jgi:small subunit ribosomal protein S1
MAVNQKTSKITNSEYDSLISSNLDLKNNKEKSIVEGKVVAIEVDTVIVDVGLKSEGRIPITEFSKSGKNPEINIGDSVKVFVDRVDDANGETKLSYEKALKQSAWNSLQYSFDNNKTVTGTPYSKVKGGMSVNLDGVIAFLPGSQIDNRQFITDTKELIAKPLELMILKMDKYRGNIVVSRKAISDIEIKKQREELLTNIKEGSILEGRIKNITDYGAFIDLGGIDGLVHITDISWRKINHPSDILEVGNQVKVKVLKYDEEITRLSLGIKQLTDDPWINVDKYFEIEKNYDGEVYGMNDQGIFLSMNNFDGFVQTTELSWLKKPPHPSKIVQIKDKIKVKILEIDSDKKRLNCSLKRLKKNPWLYIKEKFKVNDVINTKIVNIVDFGIFVEVYDEIDGMIHISDLDWDESKCPSILSNYKKGEKVSVKILDINIDKERISLSIKHLLNDPILDFILKKPVKSIISGKIISINEKGLTVNIAKNINGFIKKKDLAKDELEQRINRFAINETIDSMITSFDEKSKKINLSIKHIEINEEKKLLNKYGSKDSGASLGDILTDVLKENKSS